MHKDFKTQTCRQQSDHFIYSAPALFVPVPCSASMNKCSAYHFGPVRVRILLAQSRVTSMADAQVPVQAAVPAAQALVQPLAAPANVDNPQQNPAPLQVLISFLVICSLYCFSFSPFRLRLVIPRGRLLVPFSSLRKLRVSVVLLISLRPPSPVSTRFKLICHVFVCLASQTPGLCSAFNFPSAPLPSLHTFYLSCFVCSASQTRGLCSAFNFPPAPLPGLHTFCLSCLCASPHKHRVWVVLCFPFSSHAHFAHFLFVMFLCPSPHRHRVCVVLFKFPFGSHTQFALVLFVLFLCA